MQWDPITLVVALRKDGNAKGSLYPNDSETFDYESGAQIFTSLIFDQLSSALMLRELATAGSVTEAYQNEMSKVRVEKVIVIGAPVQWTNKHVVVEQDSKSFESKFQFHAATREQAA